MIRIRIPYTIMSALAFMGASTHAGAQSLTGNVGSANITIGERGTEFRLGSDGEGNISGRVHYDHAFKEWYQLRVIGSFSQPSDEDLDFNSFTFENWLQWRTEGSDNSGLNGGLRFAYGFSESGPDEAEIRLTLTDKFADTWEWRANFIAEMEAGDDSAGGVDLEARAQISKALDFTALSSSDWRLGTELFAELGNSTNIPDIDAQAYQIGPVVKASWDNGLYMQVGARFGITEGADDQMFKLFFGKEF